jgi:hypothetical protein
MNKKFIVGAFVGGLVLGAGATVFAQVLGSAKTIIRISEPGNMHSGLSDLITSYGTNSQNAKSAPQAQQLNSEMSVWLAYAQIKQNDEIIRLLKVIAEK